MQQKIYSLELLQTKCKCLVMPRTQEQLRKRVLELQILHRSQAVKIWELEEEKMNLVKELERMRKEKSVNEKEGVEESNQGRRVRFGGVHVSNGSIGRGSRGRGSIAEKARPVRLRAALLSVGLG